MDRGSGWVYVVDSGNSRIKKFDTSGTLLKMWGSSGPGPDEFNVPYGIALDSDGNVYVADYGHDRIQKFNSDGGFMTGWGTSGHGDGELSMPLDIAVHPNGDIYVADFGNNRVQVFTYSDLDTIEFELKAGWNMVSVPLELAEGEDTVAAVFKGEIVAIYTWDPVAKSYTAPDAIEPEVGYWVAVTEDKTITVTGTPLSDWDSDLTTGWNMVGSVCGDAVNVNALDDGPGDSVITGSIYCWNPTGKSYTTANEIAEGQGYWVATIADCTLTMTAPV